MSPLREALHDYLRLRRQLGFELKEHGPLLRDFVDFLEHAGARADHHRAGGRVGEAPGRRAPASLAPAAGDGARVRPVSGDDRPRQRDPAEDLLPARQQRVAPYIYSEAEITALMAAARALTPPLRAATFETLIGLMASTGLRLGEALGLDRHDVDLNDGVLHIRAGKQHKQREVPLHETTTDGAARLRRAARPALARRRTRRRSSSPRTGDGCASRRSMRSSRG